MKTAAVLALFLASAAAFNAPQFATRAVGKKAPAKKAAKKAAPVAKAPPESKGYPSFAAAAQSFSLGSISGGGDRKIDPVFLHPTVNTAPAPDFDYKEAAKARKTPANSDFVYDDGLTDLERKQRGSLPAFLTGSAKPNKVNAGTRSDIIEQDLPFGLDGDRFQLLFITVFGIFTLVGCLSGSISLD
eukprot:CAMPEP_0116996608 /NCGR_PEP_ID=MMETSP0472-20121206/356_1 /TAXON_ID=693140 ORGANISM="Tiarina fusus, Strain LIS" /NCGR_SAMPLE_ID=MMETSP0472 /ASSEMBLY_ACC=CAM_ASM_000603 /LENGTH=186 /DNA_ID=CAMNT_0004695283 /DNA_START=43 /DNA_END=603 /DNA_ORIENTATION=-